jgi:hypothetical protein
LPSKDPRTRVAFSAQPSLGLRFVYAETPTFELNLGVWREIRSWEEHHKLIPLPMAIREAPTSYIARARIIR